MSRIYYRGQVLRLPDQAAERAEEPRSGRGGPLRLLVPLGARSARRRTSRRSRATSSPTTAGASTTTSSRPTTRRSGACPRPRSRPTGVRSASRACRCSPRCGSRSGPRSSVSRDKSKQVTSLIEEFNYPKYGPGQMWERCTELVTAAGHQGRVRRRPSPRSSTPTAGRIAVTAEQHRRLDDALRVHRRDLVDADQRAARGDGPAACPSEVTQGGRGAALPRLHDRRPRSCPRSTASPTPGSTSTTPRSRSAASRTSPRGRRTW